MKRERPPTPEEFEKLLAWLNSNSEEAGRALNLIQSRVIKVFAARGCVDAESLADEVCNRIAVRIDKVSQTFSEPLRCFLGFVDNVYREDLREQQRRVVTIVPEPRPTDELEREDQCLDECLKVLPPPQRHIFINYFQGEKRSKRRKQLANELVLTANALRIRAHHLRKEMHKCLMTCLNQKLEGNNQL